MGTAERRSGAFINRRLETLLPALFHTASALSAPAGHLPHASNAIKLSGRPIDGNLAANIYEAMPEGLMNCCYARIVSPLAVMLLS